MNRLTQTYQDFLPERLQRLNRELMTERSKRFAYVWAVRQATPGMPSGRYRVCIDTNDDGSFFATVKAVGRVFRARHETPSGAFGKVVNSLRWGIDRWHVNEEHHRSNNTHSRVFGGAK